MFVPNFKVLGQVVPEKSLTKNSIFKYKGVRDRKINQRTNGPVDAHLFGLVKHKTWKIYGNEMTLTFNTHIPS